MNRVETKIEIKIINFIESNDDFNKVIKLKYKLWDIIYGKYGGVLFFDGIKTNKNKKFVVYRIFTNKSLFWRLKTKAISIKEIIKDIYNENMTCEIYLISKYRDYKITIKDKKIIKIEKIRSKYTNYWKSISYIN